ncbi:MAG: hypothetical protein ACR2KE_03445 [Candidatus Nanopelagicales bacterium]
MSSIVRARLVVLGTATAVILGFVPTVAPSAASAETGSSPAGSPFSPARSVEPSAAVAGVETAGPLAVKRGSGPLLAQAPPSLIVLPEGRAANPTQPFLSVPAAKEFPSVKVRLWDLTAGANINAASGFLWEGLLDRGWGRIGETLRSGRNYAITGTEPDREDWKLLGTFTVSPPGMRSGPVAQAGGVSVSIPSGEPQWQWQSPTLPGPSTDVGLGLSWNPRTTARDGLPAGWRLEPVGASAWASVTAYGGSEASTVEPTASDACDANTGATAPPLVVLRGWNGSSMSFQRNPTGVYEQVAGGLRVPGYANLLTPCEGKDARGRAVISSWRFIDPNGLTTVFKAGRASAVYAKDVLQARLRWSDGRLVGIESATGRAITAEYAGSASCASAGWTGSGFADPGTGMLCRISYPDGTATDIGYQAVGSARQIALIKDPGNLGTTLGWDTVGRIASVRGPLTNLAAVAKPDSGAASAVADIEYDATTGRVVSLVEAPATPGGPRVTQRIAIDSITADTLKRGTPVRATNTSSAPGVAGSVTYMLDPGSFEIRSMTDAAGLQTRRIFDDAGRPIGSIDAMGRRTEMTTDATGALKRQAGPYFEGNASRSRGPVQKTEYDETYASAQRAGDPLEGFRADIFREPDFRGMIEESTFWKRERSASGMNQTWRRPSAFSARLTALWNPTAADDTAAADDRRPGWTFTAQSTNATISLIVGVFECSAEALASSAGCQVTGLPAGPKQVTVEVRRSSGSGSFEIKAAPTKKVDGNPADRFTQPIPGDQVVPGFQRVTRMVSNDSYAQSSGDKATVLAYKDPSRDAPTTITEPGGLVSKLDYEPVDPRSGTFGRPVSYTTPGGLTRTTTYWPVSGTIAAPAACQGAKAVASGQPKTRTLQNGTSVTTYYDVMGRIVAQVTTGDGGATETRCLGYSAAGSLVTSGTYDASGSLIESATTEEAVDGNPLVSRVTITHGKAAPVRPDTSVTTTTTINLRGMPVEYVDEVGTVTRTTYTALDDVATVTVTPKGASAPAISTDMRYRERDGALERIFVNGVEAARVSYGSANNGGRISQIAYGGLATAELTYGPTGRPTRVGVLAQGGARMSQQVTYTDFGRATASTVGVTIPGFPTLAETRGYAYDDARRLTSATIETGSNRQTIQYAFAAQQADRCGAGYARASADALRTGGSRAGVAYTTCYDAGGRLVSTTDPQVSGDPAGKEVSSFRYDAFGRVASISGGERPVNLTWSSDTTLAKLIDGLGPDAVTTTMGTYAGRILEKTVTGSSGSQAVHYGYSSGVDSSPSVVYAADKGVTGKPLSYLMGLPGAVNVVIPADGVAAMTFTGLDGSALGTIAAPFLTLPSATGSAPGSAVGPSARFGPYGEALEAPRAAGSPAMPDYSWQAAGQLETLGGPSSITLAGARPYLPGTGTFLAPDPRMDAADNLYSYTPGDPINGTDGTGESNVWSWFLEIIGAALVVASFVVGAASGGFLLPMALGMAAAGLSLVAMKMQTEPSPALDTFRTVMFWGQIAATVVTVGASLAMLKQSWANNKVLRLLAGAGRSLASDTSAAGAGAAAKAGARSPLASVPSSLAESGAKRVVQPGKWSRFVDWVKLANPTNPAWAEVGGTRAYLTSLGKLTGKWGAVAGAYQFQSWATEWVPEHWKQAMAE